MLELIRFFIIKNVFYEFLEKKMDIVSFAELSRFA